MGNIYEIIGLKVKCFRKNKKISQNKLAEKCNVTWNTISNIERGVYKTDLVLLYKIAKLLSVPFKNFFDIEAETKKDGNRLETEARIIAILTNISDKQIADIERVMNAMLLR